MSERDPRAKCRCDELGLSPDDECIYDDPCPREGSVTNERLGYELDQCRRSLDRRRAENERLRDTAGRFLRVFDGLAQDENDGTYALFSDGDLFAAANALRQALAKAAG